MTGDKEKFTMMKPKEGGKVTFGGNQSGRIAGIGEVGRSSGTQIEDVYYVEGLCHNLLSVSQSTDKDNWVIFDSEECLIVNKKDLQLDKNSIKAKIRVQRDGNCYTIKFKFFRKLFS